MENIVLAAIFFVFICVFVFVEYLLLVLGERVKDLEEKVRRMEFSMKQDIHELFLREAKHDDKLYDLEKRLERMEDDGK